MSISDILVKFYNHEPSLIISNDGNQEGPGYVNSYESDYYDIFSQELVMLGAFHHIQYGFIPFIWKNSLFMVTRNGNIYRFTHEGKL